MAGSKSYFRLAGNLTAPKQTTHRTVMLSEAKHLRLFFVVSELAVIQLDCWELRLSRIAGTFPTCTVSKSIEFH